MTREQFVKYKFRAYMQIEYKHPRMKESIRCLLTAINFDNETMTLCAMNTDYYTEDGFDAPIQHCSLPVLIIKK